MDAKIKEYKITQRSGITDLRGSLPEGGATDWWTCEDWERHERELPEKLKWNEEYIKSLKESGDFGKEYDITISFVSHPLFDDEKITPIKESLTSSKFFFLDMKNNG